MTTSHNYTGKTLNDLVESSCHEYATRPSLSLAFKEPLSYSELFEKILALAAQLKETGVRKKDKIAILAENSPNWAMSYMAAIRIGAIVVPILPDFPESDVRHILNEAKAKVLFTTQRQIEKIYELEKHTINRIITLDDSHGDKELAANIETFSSFLAKATQLPEKKRQKLKEPANVNPEDLASIIYTSGTSGHSKAVMLSHRNLYSNVCSANQLVKITSHWTFLSILPMSHTYEFTVGFLLPFLNGARIVYAGKSPPLRSSKGYAKRNTQQPSALFP